MITHSKIIISTRNRKDAGIVLQQKYSDGGGGEYLLATIFKVPDYYVVGDINGRPVKVCKRLKDVRVWVEKTYDHMRELSDEAVSF